MPGGPVVIDLSPAQSLDYGERGIARHTVEFAKAMVERHPDLIGPLLIDPHRLPLSGVEEWAARGAMPLDCWRPQGGEILHLISPFELDQPLDRLWPRAATAAGTRLVVTVHDLIPEVLTQEYLPDPGLRRRWRARRPLVQAADRVLTLSASGRADVIRYLGVAERRVALIGAGCSSQFVPPDGETGGRQTLRREIPALAERFVVYNGGTDPRKNLDRLLVAWAQVAPAQREQRQLVIACRMSGGWAHHYQQRAEELGVGPSVLFTGLVSDAALVGLYQHTELMVFPSLYEGYGLPVVEALACGAAVIVAATSCLVELVAPEATFDPQDPAAIARAITRGLSDAPFRSRLLAAARRPAPTWGAAVDRAAAVYHQLVEDSSPRVVAPGFGAVRRSPRRKFAMIVAGSSSPWAAADGDLATALDDTRAEVDLFGGAPHTRLGERLAPVSTLAAASASRAGYDALVVTLADHPDHLQSLDWLCDPLRRAVATAVVVVARDVGDCVGVRRAVAASDVFMVGSRSAAAAVCSELPPELVGRVVVVGGDEGARAEVIVSVLAELAGPDATVPGP